MNTLSKPCGVYATNCYVLQFDGYEMVIDPGMNATDWVLKNTTNLVAILNTHGHFDHVWSNSELQKKTNAKLYVPRGDVFMLANDIFEMNMPSSVPDVVVEPDSTIEINGTKVLFHHFPGHTPGSSAIEVEGVLFSGDFVFAGSIGRTDFPYSSDEDMAKSLIKFTKIEQDMRLLAGHDRASSVKAEQDRVPMWLRHLGFS